MIRLLELLAFTCGMAVCLALIALGGAVMTRIPPVRRLLMDAKALIAKPENWTKGTFARSAAVKSRGVDVFGPRACRFCAEGAIWRANYARHRTKFDDAGRPNEAIVALNFFSPILGEYLYGVTR